MSIAEKYFNDYLNNYVPELIQEIFKKYGKSREYGLMPKYIFEDNSYIETYGGEVTEIGSNIEG